ncbi:zinc finger MYM-type protein 5-like [Lycorma delicatula]|uniref:zinc finger MYM-type protein 5-like n=1 Tax=Lycorma delicatula TaxID=130591 RepID=UPI003F514BF4
MSKRFESGACKHKKKKLQEYEAKKLTPITAYMHMPTSTTHLEAMQHVVCKDMAVAPTHSENMELIQEQLTEHEYINEPQENNTNIQNFFQTPNEKHQFQDIANLDSVVKCMSTVTDVGLWTNLSQNDVSYWVEKGPSQVQYHCVPFLNSKREYKNWSRFCTKAIFYSIKANGEKYTLEWLVYSPSKGRVFCFVCKLFPNIASSATALSEGFNDWENPATIQTHENSENHRNAMLTYLTRAKGKTLTSKLEEEIRKEQQYWRYVIERIFAVICTLAEQGLPFRGDNEKFGTPNNGNYQFF